jgi:hypothetical protein
MFKDIFGKSDTAAKYQSAGEDTGVFTLALSGVDDPFDPDPLWDRKYGGQPAIAERVSGDHDFRLQAALDFCRDLKFARDEAGRFREQSPVFTDVVMWLPAKRWHADALHGGHRIEAVATNLAALHKKKFGRSLPGDREPIYTVMPDERLDDDAVAFQFGFGVFVPQERDLLQGTLTLSRAADGTVAALPDWSFWRNGAQIKRPIGVYRGQGSLLITPDASGPVRAPVWFPSGKGHISVNLNAADSERVYADSQHIVVAKTTTPGREGDPLRTVLRPAGAKDDKDALVLELTPLPVARAITWNDELNIKTTGRRLRAVEPSTERTAPRTAEPAADLGNGRQSRPLSRLLAGRRAGSLDEGGETTPISTRYTLRLAGCALLRIDGDRRVEGLERWTIWFDADGYPLRHDDRTADLDRCLALSATAEDDRLYYRLPGEADFKPVQVMPCVLTTASRRFVDLLPSPLQEVYLGVVLLRPEVALPLSPRALILGRSNIVPSSAQPDLPLELLSHPDSLVWQAGSGYAGAKLNSLNLSRRHVALKLVDGQLDLQMIDGKMPVYVLDRDGALSGRLQPDSRDTVRLEPGQQFLIGGYMLRFHEETPRTMLSADVSQLRRRTDAD